MTANGQKSYAWLHPLLCVFVALTGLLYFIGAPSHLKSPAKVCEAERLAGGLSTGQANFDVELARVFHTRDTEDVVVPLRDDALERQASKQGYAATFYDRSLYNAALAAFLRANWTAMNERLKKGIPTFAGVVSFDCHLGYGFLGNGTFLPEIQSASGLFAFDDESKTWRVKTFTPFAEKD